jgi:hypothetical protein
MLPPSSGYLGPSKRCYLTTTLHGVATHKTTPCILIVMKTYVSQRNPMSTEKISSRDTTLHTVIDSIFDEAKHNTDIILHRCMGGISLEFLNRH